MSRCQNYIPHSFSEAIVIIQEEYENLITTSLSRLKLNIKLDYFRIKEDLGTADSLRLIYDRIKVKIFISSTAETVTN